MTLEYDPLRSIIDYGLTAADLGPRITGDEEVVEEGAEEGAPASRLALHAHWPEPALAPAPRALATEPSVLDPLPHADYLVVTWTVAEHDALAAVLTPGVSRNRWYRYAREFESRYLPKIRNGAPSRAARRLGSYYLSTIGKASVLCFKSELHLNQDGIRHQPGGTTLPVKDLFKQLIAEVKPKLVITVGTAGGVFPEHDLGDVMITRTAKFRCNSEFGDAPFNGKEYRSKYKIPTKQLAAARALLRFQDPMLVEPDFCPPTQAYHWKGAPLPGTRNKPTIRVEGGGGPDDLPDGLPILTTDYFEFGTTANGLWKEGCGVEMGDAVLGLAASELDHAPPWLVIRNASDPAINANLPRGKPRALDMQAHWAVWYYESFGYWTSVNSAIATWAVIAGDQ
jgi:hypothetical protein